MPVPFLDSILYPVIAEPPLFDGGDQDRLICVGDAEVAVRLIGELGMFDEDVVEDSTDALPVPIRLIAETL
jgi:hypothetical protein